MSDSNDASVPISALRFGADGYVSVVSQDADTGQVLLIGSMTKETLAETMETGKMVYWSRSRNERWLKGETSGDVQLVREAFVNCEENTLLFKVDQQGKGACHTGNFTCYFRTLDAGS